MQLPKKLTGWHQILSLFAPQVESDLLGIIRPLSGLFKPMLSDVNQGLIEPDGIDGIANKGKYQDLLLSEWALLDELPDEFERRFVMGEHLFLNKKKTEQNQQKLSIVLFDVGPNQFGSPKLGQLAILLLMWRRAAQSGASFRFGALQSNQWLNEFQLDEDGVLKLINSRHSNILDESNFHFWNSELDKLETEKLDLWTVSSSTLGELPLVSGNIAIKEVPFAKLPSIEFCVQTKQNKAKKQTIRLPDNNTQIRILRHPFDEIAPPRIMEKCEHRFAFSMNGRKSLRLNTSGLLYLNIIPKKLSKNVKNTQTLNVGEQVLALSTAKNEVIRLIKVEGCYRIIGIPKQGALDFGSTQNLSIDKRKLFESILYLPNFSKGQSILFKDSKNKLRMLNLSDESRQLVTIKTDVFKLGRVNSIYYFMQFKGKQLLVSMYIDNSNREPSTYPLGVYRHPKVYVHDSGPWNSNSIGCIAYQLSENSWNVVSSNNIQKVSVEPETEVFGSFMAHMMDKVPTLVVISPNRKNIRLIHDDSIKTLLESEAVIVEARMNPANQSFAFTTNGLVWRLYSIEHTEYLLDIG